MKDRLALAILLAFVVSGMLLVLVGDSRGALVGVSSIVFFGGLCMLVVARRWRNAREQSDALAYARLRHSMPFMESKRPEVVAALSDHRARFATSLVGRWHTVRGSADCLMSACWEFRPDGTVHVTSDSVLAGRDEDVYVWRTEGPFRVGLGLPPDEETPEGTWVSVRYGFAVLETDEGEHVVLHGVGERGFWVSDAPLRHEWRSDVCLCPRAARLRLQRARRSLRSPDGGGVQPRR